MTNDYFQNRLPFRFIIACGIIGVLVDFFDGIGIITGKPDWLFILDGFTTILLTIIIGTLVTYTYFRYD